ncbi:P-loop NTPase [Jeotgalibacillus marinus]|uniref:P-loop NTPase n=1 Tax=Jeotgalibacillus marinus TaxID=86667 RepID=A0ABV3Q5R9_9BACL
MVWRGPMLGKMVEHFTKDVIFGEIDYMILDLLPRTGDIALDIHHHISTCKEIIVTPPHPTAAHVAERAGVMAQKANHDIVVIVENISYFTAPESCKNALPFHSGWRSKISLVRNGNDRTASNRTFNKREQAAIYREDSLLYAKSRSIINEISQ